MSEYEGSDAEAYYRGLAEHEANEDARARDEQARDEEERKAVSALPVCPLCGNAPRTEQDHPAALDVWCDKSFCAMFQFVFGPAEWRRLAAPPLPETVRAVLEAADRWGGVRDEAASPRLARARLARALAAWIAAGRPGLEGK